MPALFEYQIEGSKFLASQKRALLADEPGLGKTAQAIDAAKRIDAENILVACPAHLRVNWAREFKAWGCAKPIDFLSSSNRTFKRGAVQIGSYNFFNLHGREFVKSGPRIEMIVLDEAHYLKNPESKRTQFFYGPECHGDGLVYYGKHVAALTGTPIPNRPNEIYPMCRAMFPAVTYMNGLQQTHREFTLSYCETFEDGAGRLTLTNKGINLGELKRRLLPFFIRRKKADVLKDLPPRSYGEITLVNDAAAEWLNANQTDEVRRQVAVNLETDVPADSLAELRRLIGIAKTAPLIDFVRDELNGVEDKIVIFAWHREVINRLHQGLAQFNPVKVMGGTSPVARQKAVDDFQNDQNVRVFIGQYLAAGEGITLTAASRVLLAEASWTPKDNVQAGDRCHRIGQNDSVLVQFVTLADSIDEEIQGALRRKTETISQIFS